MLAWSPRRVNGFYSGIAGEVYFLARAASLSGDDFFLQAARERMALLIQAPVEDHIFDVMAGMAGTVLGLTGARSWLPEDRLDEVIARSARHLFRTAHREGHGWSWGNTLFSGHRRLTGFAHGSSGIAFALIQGYRVTGQPSMAHAAYQGLRYESDLFIEEEKNWPDFRNIELLQLMESAEAQSLLQERLRRGGELPPSLQKPMNAWCHGAPGIVSAYRAAWRLWGRQEHYVPLKAALQTSTRLVHEARANHSLCHGFMGNLICMCAAADSDELSKIVRPAIDVFEQEVESVETGKRRWISGVSEGLYDPGLMQGFSGIGIACLWMLDGKAAMPLVPIVECSTPADQSVAVCELRGMLEMERRQQYPLSLECLKRYSDPTRSVDLDPFVGLSDLRVAVHACLQNVAEVIPSQIREGVETEMASIDLALRPIDLQEEFAWEVIRPRIDDPWWGSTFVRTSPFIVKLESVTENLEGAQEAVRTVLFRRGGVVRRVSMESHLLFLLEVSVNAQTLDSLVDQLSVRLSSGSNEEMSGLSMARKIDQLLRSGLLIACLPSRSSISENVA